MSRPSDSEKYWTEYSNLQHVKHALIRHYLNGWFPKMALGPWGATRLLYIDTHAGRGKHRDGTLGSPLIALRTLLAHTSRDRILERCEVRYCFIERDIANLKALQQELAETALPKNIFVDPKEGNAFEIIEQLTKSLDEQGSHLAPSFVFVDPFGFKLSGQLLRTLLSYPRVELFINVIWRELDMAINQARQGSTLGMVNTLNSVFDGNCWQTINAENADARADQCADLFRNITNARWGTHIRMLDHGRIRYFLLHLTNHDAGRDLMKECIWKACPQGGYYASKQDDPRQRLLIQPEPDLHPLQDWVTSRLAAGPKRWQELLEAIREELWLEKHLNEVIRAMRKVGEIVGEK